MNIEQNTLDALNAELTIHLQPTDYNERFERAIKTHRKRANMPGFRPGTVPASLIKKRFGKALLAEEINSLLQDVLFSYIQDNKLNVLGNPIPKSDEEVGNWEEPGDFRFTYELGLAPEVPLTIDSSLTFTYRKVKLDDTLIKRQVKDLARRFGQLSEPEVSEAEDMIMAQLQELNADGTAKDGVINSQTTVSIEYLKDQATRQSLIGLKKGDKVVVNPNHLSSNHEDLAKMLGITHNDVHHLGDKFELTVNEVKRMAPHELNQELFDKLYGKDAVTSEEQMRERVKGELEEMFARDSEWLFKREFARRLVEAAPFELPDAFLKRWIALTNEKPLSEDALEAEYPAYASGLRWQLIENHIARTFDIRVTMDDAMQYVKDQLSRQWNQYGLPIDEEMLDKYARQTLSDKEQSRNIYSTLTETRMSDVLKEKCTIVTEEMAYDDFVHYVQHL
jgi:trigger factor